MTTSIKEKRHASLNKMGAAHVYDAKRYLGYCINDFTDGKKKSVWCIHRDENYSSKVFSIILKSLTYLCIDFSFNFRFDGCYWRFAITFEDLK